MLLTHDHSVVQELLDSGRITLAEAEHHLESHVVTRAVGAMEQASIDLTDVALAPGDVLILCSDGLTKCVPETEIAALIQSEPSSGKACRRLIDAAIARGAPDNVSVILVRANGDAAT
jgi:serine/threonine protein phosphatase PrpC